MLPVYSLSGAPILPQRKRPADDDEALALSDAEVDASLAQLSRNSGSMLETLNKTLDTPGAIARGIMAGDPWSGFSWDSDRRVSGEELLDSYGLLKKDQNPYVRAGAGWLAEVATDPLTWLQLPMSALTKAGKAAKMTNLLDYAPIAAQRKMGNAAAAQTMAGRYTESALNSLVSKGMAKSDATYAVRPLVGPRVARTLTTLDDVAAAAPDPTKATADLTKYFAGKGLNFDDYRTQKLGGAFGIGPFTSLATFTPPGSRGVLDALDTIGQGVAWSYPARLASSAFDQRVNGMIDADDQIAALKHWDAVSAAKQQGRRIASDHAQLVSTIPMSSRAKTLLGADSLLSPQGNDFLTRVFENKPTAADRTLMAELPGIDAAVTSWDKIRQNNAKLAGELGMDFTPITDPKYGTMYSPRSGTEFDFGEYGSGYGRSMFSTQTAEALRRNPSLHTPGGTDDLRQISMLPIVRDYGMKGSASQYSERDVGEAITNWLNTKYGAGMIDPSQGEGIARVMYRMNKDLPANVPVFADHPLNAQARVIVSQESARANAKQVYDDLVEAAIVGRANAVPGSGYKRLDSASRDIASKVGLLVDDPKYGNAVTKQLTDRLAAKFGMAPDAINLGEFAIPEQVFNRLSRIQDFYSSPRAQDEVSGMFDAFTNLFKGFVLAWPARHVRDAYSNVFSVWLETGNPAATLSGFSTAKKILAGNIDSAIDHIAKLPQYQNIADPRVLKQKFISDAASSGILTSLSSSDVLTAKRAGEISQLVPGITPVTRLGAFRELVPTGNPLKAVSDFGQIRGLTNTFETRNPVLNWSQKLNDANDSIARLGGYIAMLKGGASPEYAAKRMHEALVDYQSLTTLERGFLKKIFPWWSYQSRIGKYVVQQMMEKPGGPFAQAVRGMNALQRPTESAYTPEDMRDQFAIRVPDAWKQALGMPVQPGVTTYLKDFDFPGFDTLSIFRPDSIQRTVENIFGQTNPFIKGSAEIAFNKDLFSKKPLEDTNSPVDRIYRAITGSSVGLSPVTKVIASNIPGTQRVVGLAGGLLDDRLPIGERVVKQGFNAAAGVKRQDVDKRQELFDAARENSNNLKGYSKDFVITTIPKENLVNAPPEVLKQVALDRAIKQRIKALSPPKAKASTKKKVVKAPTAQEIFGF